MRRHEMGCCLGFAMMTVVGASAAASEFGVKNHSIYFTCEAPPFLMYAEDAAGRRTGADPEAALSASGWPAGERKLEEIRACRIIGGKGVVRA
jgi:hypothetical protein